MSVGALLLCAGKGERLGAGVDKALAPLAGRPLFVWSLETLERCRAIEGIVVVGPVARLKELLATCGLGGLTYALTLWSATRHFTDEALTALVVGAVALAGFLALEYRRGLRAMMPLSLFRGRCFSGLNLLTFLLYAAFSAGMLLIPYVLITSGVEEGAKIVALGVQKLDPGQRVRVVSSLSF